MPQQRDRARLDLSLAQVAASALAAIVGAVLASELGVYGTIIGAAVVSVGATTGGAVFQHVFKRTGEQLRAVGQPAEPTPVGEWNEPRTLRAKRPRTWKTYTVVSALVFALAMTPILVVELATGKPVSALTGSSDDRGTSFTPRQKSTAPPSEVHEQPDRKPPGDSSASPDKPSGTPSPTPSGRPSGSPSPSVSPSGSPTPSPPSPTTGRPTDPATGTGSRTEPPRPPASTPTG
ncbi:hypothetical protein ABT095_17505 [Kitasatospora sp. NPDC002227]|uniref:hypothetical protein n=1 Tax=Kitasatospora sp. NPDC002227 TaxID=3154773 RepID=UPI0033293F12